MSSTLSRTTRPGRPGRMRHDHRSAFRKRVRSFIVMGGIAMLVWSVLFSGFFTVHEIVIEGPDGDLSESVHAYSEGALHEANMFFIDTDTAEKELLERMPELEDVCIHRSWPDTLVVHTVPRKALGIWCRTENSEQVCSLFDRTAVWGYGVPSRGTIMLAVMDERPEGGPSVDIVDSISVIRRRLQELDISINRITLPAGVLDEIHVSTTEGYPIYFSTQTNLDEALDVLEAFIGERRAQGPFLPSYIDLRVPGKAYFR